MFKKLIVVLAFCALITGVAFAEATVGGQLQMGSMLFSGTNINDRDIMLGGNYDGSYKEAKLSLLFGDGTAGGRMVYTFNSTELWGWLQWRPSQFFRLRIGKDGDGEGGFPQIIGWGFTGEAKNSVAAVSDYNGSLAMQYRNAGLNYGAFDGIGSFNFQLSFYPTDMLQLNVLFRGFDSEGEVSDKLANMQIYGLFKIEEVGTIRFAAVGNGGLAKEKQKDGDDIATIHLAFYSSEIVRGLAFEFGGQVNLPRYNQADTMGAIKLAGGINMTTITDPFNLKVRFGTEFGGMKEGVENEKVGFTVGILPSYKLPKMTIFFHAGLGLEQANKDADMVYNWFINPYVWVPMGGMRMWVGVQIIDEHDQNDGQFAFKIPFGFNFYF